MPSQPERFEPLAGILAVILPGAGHLYLRETWRAAGVAAGVLGLFFAGMLIGGIDVVESRESRIWFLGQALVGPVAFGVDRLNQTRFKGLAPDPESGRIVLRSAYPGETLEMGRNPATGEPARVIVSGPDARPPISRSLARVNEVGTLYGAIAGMLNLIAVLDALFHRRRRGAAS